MNEILLIGAGGHASSCIDVIESKSQYKVVGLVERENSKKNLNLRYPILGADIDLKVLRKDYKYAFIAIGQIKSPKIRIKLYKLLKDLDFTLPTIISKNCYVSKNAEIGEGSIIMHGAIVNVNAKIGNNSIINNRALIEHDSVIGDHCHIATSAIINGGVNVGNETFIGSGVVTKQGISIGNNSIIGAGVVLKSNIDSNMVIKN